jgi:hypothetical protein
MFRYHGFAMNEETKRCAMCAQYVSTDVYNKRANGKCLAYCKACQSIYSRNHYVRNKNLYKQKRAASNRRYYVRNRSFAMEYLRKNPCVDCGESDPVVLDFDHRDRTTKTNEVSNLIRQAFSLKRITREINLCDVRCARCHRRRTAVEFGWGQIG